MFASLLYHFRREQRLATAIDRLSGHLQLFLDFREIEKNIEMLKDCLLHHVYCAHLGTPWHRAVTAFCAVSGCPGTFLSFFLGFRRHDLVTGLSEWQAPDQPLRTQEPVQDRGTCWGTGALPSDSRGFFWFLVFGLLCRHTASNPITTEMHKVVRSNKEARKRLTESNSTPAMDPGHTNIDLTYTLAYCCEEDIRRCRHTNKRGIEQNSNASW